MRLDLLGPLSAIRGCTFASLDTTTSPRPFYEVVRKNEGVLLFANQEGSGYERMVRRRLEEAGKDPAGFVLGDLPWGERIEGTPLISHKGNHYLQLIQLKPGEVSATYHGGIIDPSLVPGIDKGGEGQGLGDRRVVVRAYKLDSIDEIRLMNQVIARGATEGEEG